MPNSRGNVPDCLLRLNFAGFFHFITAKCQNMLNEFGQPDDLQQQLYAVVIKQLCRNNQIISLSRNRYEVEAQRVGCRMDAIAVTSAPASGGQRL